MDAFERLVTVNRFNPPASIPLSISLTHNLDKQWCDEMSRAMMKRFKWSICEATSTLHELLPEKMGRYMFVWRMPFRMPSKIPTDHFRVVLYVGQAGGESEASTLQTRYRQEYAKIVGVSPESIWTPEPKTRQEKLSRFLNLRDLEFWYHDNVSDCNLLKSFETALISVFNPPANTVGRMSGSSATVMGTIGKPIPAF